jgi:tRNA-dihydrouridine synthase B
MSWPLAEPLPYVGGLTLPNRVALAPMAGVCNSAYRQTARAHGAGLLVSEMVSSYGLHYENKKTLDFLRIHPSEHPLAVQIFGDDPHVMAEAARKVEAAGADIVDINMGCPARKIYKTGAGASLLRHPDLAGAVAAACVAAVSVPVTVKIRAGFDDQTRTAVDVARRLESVGVAALAVHPRLASQEYRGEADHRVTAEVVHAVGLPVWASGDVDSPAKARRVLDGTGAVGVMVARASLGDPWIFESLTSGIPRRKPTPPELATEALAIGDRLIGEYGPERAGRAMRKHYAWLFKGRTTVPNEWRVDLLRAEPSAAREMLAGLAEGTTAEPLALAA